MSDDGYVNHVDHRACGARLYLFWSERPNLNVAAGGVNARFARISLQR